MNDEKYIDDLISARAENKKSKDLLDNALFLISCYAGLHPKIRFPDKDFKKVLQIKSMDFLYKLYGKKMADDKSSVEKFANFIIEKQDEHVEREVMSILKL